MGITFTHPLMNHASVNNDFIDLRGVPVNREAAARRLGIKPHTFRKRAKEKIGS